MKLRMLATASVAATLAAGAAQAATTVTWEQYGFAVNAGESQLTSFEAVNLLSLPLAGGFSLQAGPTANLAIGCDPTTACPALSATPGDVDNTRYLSVLGGQFVGVNTPNIKQISFYVGSLDTYNTFTFLGAGGGIFTGVDIANLAIGDAVLANGNQQLGTTNGRVTFKFDGPVTGFILSSSQNSLEVSNVGVLVPEPSTWAMMILGFGGVGAVMRRRRLAIA
jgi:hypothetical protein